MAPTGSLLLLSFPFLLSPSYPSAHQPPFGCVQRPTLSEPVTLNVQLQHPPTHPPTHTSTHHTTQPRPTSLLLLWQAHNVDAVVHQRPFAATTARHVGPRAPPPTTHPRRTPRTTRPSLARSLHTPLAQPATRHKRCKRSRPSSTTKAERRDPHGLQQCTPRRQTGPSRPDPTANRHRTLRVWLKRGQRTLEIRQLR